VKISKIEVRNYDTMKVASIRYKGKYSDCGKYFKMIFKSAIGKLARLPPMLLCHDSEYKSDAADCEACVPVRENVLKDGVTTRELPATKAVSCIYTGGYDQIYKVYDELMNYAKEKGFEWVSPSREIYIKGPGMIFKGNPAEYITEVVLPVKEV